MDIQKQVFLLLLSALLISAASNNINNKNNNQNNKIDNNINTNNQVVFQLVKPDPTHTNLEVIPEGLERLNSISQKVVVISAIGEYHSGKSFLLNQIMNDQLGFALGPTVAPETKGIWARVSYVEDTAIVFLDTEGFFGQGAAESYDAKIFAVATLLSSKLLFNSVKTIDQASMDYLELLARRALMFSLKASVKEHYGSSYLSFPSLTWIVRDFISEIPSSYGGSPSAWINHLLSVRKRESVSISGDEEERMTNQELSKIFSSIDCLPLPYPISSHGMERLKNLDKVPMDELDINFKAGIAELKSKIYSNLEKKKFHNQELNGFGLAELLKTLVELANTGIFPKVPGVWEGFIRVESQTALGDCTESFRKEVQAHVNATLPLAERNLQIIFEREEQESLRVLRAMLLGLTEIQNKVASQLKTELGKLRERFEEENARNIQSFCSHAREMNENEMDKRVAEFNLPISPASLKKNLQEIAADVQSSYKYRVSAYSGSPHCVPSAAGLSKHIEKVQATVDSANLVALRKSCADAKSLASQKFSVSLSSLSLPLSPSFVKKECEKGMEAALKDFDEKTKEFKGTEAQSEIRKELEHVLALRKENTILANNNQIEEKILALGKKIVVAKTKKYSDYQLKTASQMNELKDQLVKEATAQFEESATYALESNSFPAWKLQFITDIKAAGDRLSEANRELVAQFFANETESHLKTLRSRMRSVKARIPLEEREIESQIETQTAAVKSEWETKTKNYISANQEAYHSALLTFNTEAHDTAATLRRENVNELLRLSKAALERGERRMEEVYKGAWFQYLFTREVTAILQQELGETIKSEKLRNEAIQAYIEDNLDKKFPFSPILTFVQFFVGIVAVVSSIVIGTACFPKSSPRPITIKKGF